ncbi:MAG: phosphate propanoyltransferase [Endomicrobiia bacterium]|nr:phosphate propanoyltransferase [Endomicrobiaceae bacterium]MDD3053179.1 phosphate propanoyltransferase [Endomicrobiaceae bacterium]MDD3922048.1 phosphate propanoyltransferase [Endomicrobiaceae bacterium]MDD5101489.1 phosphate propanoyltransferase [Endomicrobiaceae bacterium]
MQNNRASKPIITNISNRHIHLSKDIMEVLFGKDYQLTKTKDLMQPGEYACNETLTLVGPKNSIERVRVLGPIRKQTQVEVSVSDAIKLGIAVNIRLSGDLAGSQPIKLVGPNASVDLKEGCVVAKRHIHFSTKDAEFYGIKDKESLSLKIEGERGLVFNNVIARVSDNMISECHLDIEEANSAGVKNGTMAILL